MLAFIFALCLLCMIILLFFNVWASLFTSDQWWRCHNWWDLWAIIEQILRRIIIFWLLWELKCIRYSISCFWVSSKMSSYVHLTLFSFILFMQEITYISEICGGSLIAFLWLFLSKGSLHCLVWFELIWLIFSVWWEPKFTNGLIKYFS